MKFGHLILRKIIKFVVTSCQISRLKCTKFDFGWGSAPDPAGEAYSASSYPVAGLMGPSSTDRGGEWKSEGRGRSEGGMPHLCRGGDELPW